MEYVITGYEPARLFQFFEEISAIPRGSGNEKAISDYLVAFARERGLEVIQDENWNVIIKKPASAGAEGKPPVMLQGHTDMVCEKLAGVEHDFEKDGLKLSVVDGCLTADGTTLGADNGVAVALMLMVLDDDSLAHPPVECVFTTEEEIGLNGASTLDKSLLQARTMINLDSEDEGIATVSCAGGVRIALTRAIERENVHGSLVQISIEGLLGGHSGTDIDQERANANLLMARMVSFLMRHAGGRLAEFAGGSKDNAIPRECVASLIYENEADAAKAEELACGMAEKIADEISMEEPNFSCEISVEEHRSADVLKQEDAKAFLTALRLAPNGVQKRNLKADGAVVLSSNLGVARAQGDQIRMVFAPRSSVSSLKKELTSRIVLLAETFGFDTSFSGEYPGWSYKEVSPIRDVFQASYRELFGNELKIEAIHAGLECGLFSDAMPGLDAIAVGPSIYGCHTPDERLPLDSVERFYRLLTDVLARLARGE